MALQNLPRKTEMVQAYYSDASAAVHNYTITLPVGVKYIHSIQIRRSFVYESSPVSGGVVDYYISLDSLLASYIKLNVPTNSTRIFEDEILSSNIITNLTSFTFSTHSIFVTDDMRNNSSCAITYSLIDDNPTPDPYDPVVNNLGALYKANNFTPISTNPLAHTILLSGRDDGSVVKLSSIIVSNASDTNANSIYIYYNNIMIISATISPVTTMQFSAYNFNIPKYLIGSSNSISVYAVSTDTPTVSAYVSWIDDITRF